MLICGAIGLIAGALLAWRFQVFLLVPAIVIASVAILLFGAACRLALSQTLVLALVAASALQLGFLAGVFILARFKDTSEGAPASPRRS